MTTTLITRAALGLLVLGMIGLAPAPAPARSAQAGSPAATAALATGGAPWTWGGNGFGQLGSGTTQARLTPGPVNGLTDVTDLHGGREHVAALRSNGTVWTWGSNAQGQLGLGSTANRPTPTQVAGIAGATAVETGHNSSLALLPDGSVRTWGLNADGQLGDGSTTLRRAPVQVSGLSDAVAIAAGRNMSYALRANGTVVAWGANDQGQLGDGSTVRRTVPVPVVSLTDVVRIAGGRDHGLAVRSDGSVWAWGSNDYGQLGDGTQIDRTSPVQVMGGALEVIAGAHHSYALRADHTVAAWGRNYRANLGDGTTTSRTRPVSVRSLTGVVSIGSGRDTGLAVLSDGRVMAWGSNSAGQVGDGTLVNRSVPVVVPGIDGAVLAGGGGEEYSVVLVAPDVPPSPRDPVAAFGSSCDSTSCVFDATASADPDGDALVYDWAFVEGQAPTRAGATTQHDFTAAGTYPVTLTVTDESGATGTITHDVVVQDQPTVVAPLFRAGASSDSNTRQPTVVVPASVQPTDRLVLFVTTNRAASLTTPAGWALLGSVSDSTDVRSWTLTRAAGPGLAGTSLQLALEASAKTSVVLLAYSGAGAPSAVTSRAEPGSTATHAAPAAQVAQAASRVVRYYVDKSSSVHTWSLPPALTTRATTTGSGSGLLVSVVGDQEWSTPGVAPALSATSGVSASKALAWTLVLPPSP